MLWCDKNEVHGFFVFLVCCSFESYRWLWLVQQVGALPLTIHQSFLQDKTYTSKVIIAFLTEWMPCLFSMEFSEDKPIRTSPLETQTLDIFLSLTCNLVLHRPIFESRQMKWRGIQSWSLCLCILHCEMLYKNASIPVSRHEHWVASCYLCIMNTSLTLKIPLCCPLSLWTMIVAFLTL